MSTHDIHTQMHTYTFIHTCIHTYPHIIHHTHTYTCIHTHIHLYAHTCTIMHPYNGTQMHTTNNPEDTTWKNKSIIPPGKLMNQGALPNGYARACSGKGVRGFSMQHKSHTLGECIYMALFPQIQGYHPLCSHA